MLPRPVVALWRTSAAAAAVVLLATACGHTEAARQAGATTTVPNRPQLAPTAQKPLKVKGTGFQPNEKVSVVANGGHNTGTIADSSGTFVVRLPGVDSCDSVTVVATGSNGSHAEFNLSQIACIGD
jgi:glucose/arabinose dehydrogenase